jgi:hypothetical protein
MDVGSFADVSEALSPYSWSKIEATCISEKSATLPTSTCSKVPGVEPASKWDEM